MACVVFLPQTLFRLIDESRTGPAVLDTDEAQTCARAMALAD